MPTFHPSLPDSFKAGEVFKFDIKHDGLIESVVVTQEHISQPRDEFIGKGKKDLHIQFVVNLASTSVTLCVNTKGKTYEIKRPVHWKD